MIFPKNVSQQIRDAGKTSGQEKIGLFFSFSAFLCVITFPYFQSILSKIGFGFIGTLLTQLAIMGIVLFFVFRIFIVNEKDKIKEYEGSQKSSLDTYFNLRDKEYVDTVETAPYFEYSNGNLAVFLNLTYGYNTNNKKVGNEAFLTSVINESLKYNMVVRVYNTPEVFEESPECKSYLKNLSNIEDDRLRTMMGEFINYNLKYCNNFSELMSTTIIIQTTNPYQLDNLGLVIKKILESYSSSRTSIRGLEFFGKEKLRAFLRDYYRLEALDLSGLKSVEVDKKILSKYRKFVKVHEINLKDGKTIMKDKLILKTEVSKFD